MSGTGEGVGSDAAGSDAAAGLGSGAALVALRVVSGATAAIMVLVITFYMLLEGAAIKRAFVPEHLRALCLR